MSQKLASAFASGDAAAAAALFTNDAVYLDRPLRVRILGKQAIGKYLARVCH
jgi:ketosteroid isomerase-like protein